MRTIYRILDSGELASYKLGRVTARERGGMAKGGGGKRTWKT